MAWSRMESCIWSCFRCSSSRRPASPGTKAGLPWRRVIRSALWLIAWYSPIHRTTLWIPPLRRSAGHWSEYPTRSSRSCHCLRKTSTLRSITYPTPQQCSSCSKPGMSCFRVGQCGWRSHFLSKTRLDVFIWFILTVFSKVTCWWSCSNRSRSLRTPKWTISWTPSSRDVKSKSTWLPPSPG